MSTTSQHPYATGVRWFRRLLTGQPHQIIGESDNPYMLRWYVIPRNPLLNIYVHRFVRSDDDRALHDHPWWFVSLILRGGYVEHRPDGQVERRAPSVAFRHAEQRHRVELLGHYWPRPDRLERDWIESPCWTLIITGPKRRGWGFWCKNTLLSINGRHVETERFVPWREWGDGGCGETA